MTNEIIGKSASNEQSLSEINVMRKMLDNVENHAYRIANLEDTMRVNAVQENMLTEEVNKKIVGFLQGKKAPAYRDNHIRGKAYSDINHAIRKRFGVRRREIPAKNFHDAVSFIRRWSISTELQNEIFNANQQVSLFN